MLPEWLEINNWSGFLPPPHGIMASRLSFPQLLVIQKYLIHFYNIFFSLFHCLDFAGIWVWLPQFGLWAAHQGMSTSQVLEVGVVAGLGKVQDGPLIPGTPAGLLRVWQDLLHTRVMWTRLIWHGLATRCCQPFQDWSSGKSLAHWDKPFLAVFCPSMEKGTRAILTQTWANPSLWEHTWGVGKTFLQNGLLGGCAEIKEKPFKSWWEYSGAYFVPSTQSNLIWWRREKSLPSCARNINIHFKQFFEDLRFLTTLC